MVLFLYVVIICYLPILDDFIPKTNFGKGIPDIGPYRFGFFMLFLFFIIHAVIKKDIRFFHTWITYLAIFYATVVASVYWSVYSYNSLTIQELFNAVFIPFFLALVAINLFAHEKSTNKYVQQIIFAAFILSIMSIVQMIMGVMAGHTDIRAAGTYGNPNRLAIAIVLTIPCLIYAMEKKIISEKIGWIYSVSVVAGIICTVSRKGIIAMVLCYMLYYFLRKNYRRVVTLLIVFAMLAAVVSGYSVVTQRFEKEEFLHQLGVKWEMTKAGGRMFATSPLVGLGYKGYYQNFGRFFPNAFKEKYDAHNIFITAIANYGLLGIFPFLMIFLYPLMKAIRILRRHDPRSRNIHSVNMAILCLTTVIPFMVMGWYAGGLFYSYYAVALLYTNVSMVLAYDSEKKDASPVQAGYNNASPREEGSKTA